MVLRIQSMLLFNMICKLIVLICLFSVSQARYLEVERPYFRILNGTNAQSGEFPYMVSLQEGSASKQDFEHFCGGSIINDQWILTAAHCLDDLGTDVVVKAGKRDLNVNESSEQSSIIKSFFKHDKYIEDLFTGGPYDIGLIKLEHPLQFNDNVAPINLPKNGTKPTGSVSLSGWGIVGYGVDGWHVEWPNILQRTDLEIVDLATCEKAFVQLGLEDFVIINEDWVHESNICTGPTIGGLGACIGDSGSPLISKDKDGKSQVVGIVSWSWAPCGRKGAPVVYAKVSSFISWIENTVAKN